MHSKLKYRYEHFDHPIIITLNEKRKHVLKESSSKLSLQQCVKQMHPEIQLVNHGEELLQEDSH